MRPRWFVSALPSRLCQHNLFAKVFACRLRVWHDGLVVNTDEMPLVLVSAGLLDDLCELARMAANALPEHDPIRRELRGAISEVRARCLMEP